MLTNFWKQEFENEVVEMEVALDKMNRSLSRINRELSDFLGEKLKLETRLKHIKTLYLEKETSYVQCVVC